MMKNSSLFIEKRILQFAKLLRLLLKVGIHFIFGKEVVVGQRKIERSY